jgi:hypothetical protein
VLVDPAVATALAGGGSIGFNGPSLLRSGGDALIAASSPPICDVAIAGAGGPVCSRQPTAMPAQKKANAAATTRPRGPRCVFI